MGNPDEISNVKVTPPSARFGVRHVQAVLMAICSVVGYSMRANLSVAIVAMVAPPVRANFSNFINSTNATLAGPSSSGAQVFEWSESVQGTVLSAFFWGYMLSQVPAGVLSQRYGGCKFLAGSLLSTSVVTLLMPHSAFLGGWKAVFVNRLLQGVTQGFLYPSIYTLLGLWAPPVERGRAAGFILGSQLLGPVVASPLAGFLADSRWGWPSVFYVSGLVGLLAGGLMWTFGADSPARHARIGAEELSYIQTSIDSGPTKERAPKTPWCSAVTSAPVWAVWITMSSQAGIFFTFLTSIPTYLSAALGFNMRENGLLTSLPYLTSLVLTALFTVAADVINKRQLLSLGASRKTFNGIASVFCALPVVAMGYSRSPALCVVLLCIAMGALGATYVASQPNYLDIAPLHSGPLFSVGNLMAASLGVVGPLVVGFVVTDTTSVLQWRIVFWGKAILIMATHCVFMAFGSSDVQPWNSPEDRRRSSNRALSV